MEEKVLKALQEAREPLKGGQIAELIGEESKDVTKAIKKLKDTGKVESPKRCFYQAVKK